MKSRHDVIQAYFRPGQVPCIDAKQRPSCATLALAVCACFALGTSSRWNGPPYRSVVWYVSCVCLAPPTLLRLSTVLVISVNMAHACRDCESMHAKPGL